MPPVVILLQTVFASILEVFVLCVAGYVLARRGVLDKKTQKQINRLNVSLFTPSLLFSKVAFFLTPAKLRELWIIPIFFVLVTTVSMSVSYLLGWTFRLKKSQRSFAVAAAMFMNSNSLPIALMQSLVVTVDGLQWDDDDTKSSMLGRALTYLVLYSTLGMVLRWSYGVHLLTQADTEPVQTEPEAQASETSPLLFEGGTTTPREDNDALGTLRERPPSFILTDTEGSSSAEDLAFASPKTAVPERIRGSDKSKTENARVFRSFPNTPTASRQSLPVVSPEQGEDASSDGEYEDVFSARWRRNHVIAPTSTRIQSFFRRARHRVGKVVKTTNQFMTVPLWAALASLLVACIQPLQHALDEHSQPIKGALTAAGNCSIPLTLVVLGAYFHTPDQEKRMDLPQSSERRGASPSTASERSLVGSVRGLFKMTRSRNGTIASSSKQEKTRPGETRTVVIAVVSRMIITPMLVLPLMALSAKYNIPEVFEDPVFVVANVLLVSSPPALTLAQITQAAASGDAFERLISRTIFWAYCVVTPPATIIYVVIGMLLSKL